MFKDVNLARSRFITIFRDFPKSRNFCSFPRQMQLMLNTATFQKIVLFVPEIHEFHANQFNPSLHSLFTQSSLLHSHSYINIILHISSFFTSFWVLRRSCWSRKIDFNMARSRFITFFHDFSEIPRLLPFPAPFAATFQISAATFSFFCAIFWRP